MQDPRNIPNVREWLRTEQIESETGSPETDAAAERMFARAIVALAPVEPTASFVDRTAHAAWRARSRRRLLGWLAVAAAVLVGAIISVLYVFPGLPTMLFVNGTVAMSQGLVWLLTSATAGAGWWSIADRIAAIAGDAVSAPSAVAAIVALELLALAAIGAFRQLGDQEKRVAGAEATIKEWT